jgi:prepilin-type N-terminal cleavage/methylation domain-containing protein/prepilin-type processing-associated H-X9-DG protein
MNNMNMTTRDTRRDGFTLIELLVVISIIALLVGILLPALGAARRSAQSAVCLGHQRSIGQGTAVYASNNSDWLAGPFTSGFAIGNGGTPQNSPTAPVQNMDWVSPTLGDSLGLPANRNDRILAIANVELKCPSNGDFYDQGFAGGGLNYQSYSAALGFHHLNAGDNPYIPNPIRVTVDSPLGYRPRLDRVGPPSLKVLAMDGARYVDGGLGNPKTLSYNDFPKQIRGGNYMEWGPMIAFENGPWEFPSTNSDQPTEDSLRLGFRHSGSVNLVFFDGHGESMKAAVAHPTAGLTLESITPWFPSESIIAGGVGKVP